jgi:hypothetical protein
MPNASIINFVPGLNIANGLIQPICHPMSSCISDLSIYAASTVDVVADVTGYFRKPGPAYPRTTFKIVSLPAADSYTTLATLTFTPVATGTVYLRSRGYCNMFQYVSDDNDVWISAGTSTAEAFDDSVDSSDIHGWGVMSFPVTGSGLFQMMWTSERAFSVTKGVSTTVYLYARHYSGGTGTNCSGSFSIDQRF